QVQAMIFPNERQQLVPQFCPFLLNRLLKLKGRACRSSSFLLLCNRRLSNRKFLLANRYPRKPLQLFFGRQFRKVEFFPKVSKHKRRQTSKPTLCSKPKQIGRAHV